MKNLYRKVKVINHKTNKTYWQIKIAGITIVIYLAIMFIIDKLIY